MLRLQNRFQPRVSNQLAAVSAILLLVCVLAGPTNANSMNDPFSFLPEEAQMGSVETSMIARQASKVAANKAKKLHLMIFWHN